LGGRRMKMMISATLSMEAAEIYSNWEKQQKSRILSELIVKENTNLNALKALKEAKSETQMIIHQAMIRLYTTEGKSPLVLKMNDSLIGNVHLHNYDW
jgi:hypothetical protein